MSYLIAGTLLVVIHAAVLRAMGSRWQCECGRIRAHSELDDGVNHDSQHAFGLWSLTHILHGIVFAAPLYWIGVRADAALLIVLAIEIAWEIVENTGWLVRAWQWAGCTKYRGDSVLNSVGDVLCCMFGATWILGDF